MQSWINGTISASSVLPVVVFGMFSSGTATGLVSLAGNPVPSSAAPRDRWVGWKRGIQFARLHLISNNTRFLILGEPGCFPNLASFALAGMTRRLSADWYAAWGHELLLAETFVDPSRFCGHMYAAAGWTRLGRTKGFARASGKYTDTAWCPQGPACLSSAPGCRRRMREPCDLADGLQPSPMGRMSALPSGCLRSLYDELFAGSGLPPRSGPQAHHCIGACYLHRRAACWHHKRHWRGAIRPRPEPDGTESTRCVAQ